LAAVAISANARDAIDNAGLSEARITFVDASMAGSIPQSPEAVRKRAVR
jgi:hypothetical protein